MARGDGAGSLFCKGLLICSGFFTLGLCLSIIGPTLPDIQLSTKADSLVSVAGIVTASGFGALLGITFGSAVYALANPFFVMGVILCGTAAITLTIPWCTTITGLNLVCFIQGICLGTVERGGYSLFFAYWPKRYSALQLFYVALAFGACVAPLVTTPFVFNHVQPSLTGAVGSGNNNHMRHKREPPLDFNETLTTLNPAALNTPIAAGAAGNENGTSPDSSLTTLPVAVKPSVAVGDGSIDTKAKQNSVMRNKINEDKAAPTPSTANVSSTTPGELAITTSASLLSGMQTQPEGTEMDGVKVTSSSLSTSVPAEAGASSSTTTSTTTTST
uniref:Uncharacterized protein n=1 Tax=Plectus sambesii TaxID=2011161 RepID=A0A914XQ79_9BILA